MYHALLKGLVHMSHFCRVEFNSIKCSRYATVDSYMYITLVLHLIQNYSVSTETRATKKMKTIHTAELKQ